MCTFFAILICVAYVILFLCVRKPRLPAQEEIIQDWKEEIRTADDEKLKAHKEQVKKELVEADKAKQNLKANSLREILMLIEQETIKRMD